MNATDEEIPPETKRRQKYMNTALKETISYKPQRP